MNQAVSVPQISPQPETPPERIAFTGRRDEFRKLVTRGGLLEFVTLGFYRFWLTTDMRRHLWSHTVVKGDAPEYTGRARELLIGFLVAMAILVPIYLVYFLIGLWAETYRAFASVPLVAFLYLFGQFAIYRARRYRMTRTVWRGVRFWMTGSGWAYAFRAGAWGLLVLFTLGLALPWRDAALERYKMRHSYYGSLQGSFVGRGSEFFKRAWWLWLLSPTAILVIPAPFIYGAFKSIQWKWWIEGVRFGDVEATSTLRKGVLIGRYWGAIGWSALFSTILGIFVSALYVVFGATVAGDVESELMKAALISSHWGFITILIVAYLCMIVAMNVVLRLYLVRDIWDIVVRSVSVTGLEGVEDVAAQGELAGALGEGFADGLDVGGL
jgi:uncharacterized membrane protein YjgN (DUF898 family)